MVKAIRIHKTGGPEVLQWEDITLPAPGPGELLVRNRAIGLNFIDTYFRSGLYPAPQLPFVPGNEGAGEVLAAQRYLGHAVDFPFDMSPNNPAGRKIISSVIALP